MDNIDFAFKKEMKKKKNHLSSIKVDASAQDFSDELRFD
jgi:hypothetical protein